MEPLSILPRCSIRIAVTVQIVITEGVRTLVDRSVEGTGPLPEPIFWRIGLEPGPHLPAQMGSIGPIQIHYANAIS